MRLDEFVFNVCSQPDEVEFDDIMAFIDQYYDYQPAAFINGDGYDNPVYNEAGSNEGSCKIFALCHLLNLDESATLACFGKYYREDVLMNPEGDDHANIRSFMRCGWGGISFNGVALVEKGAGKPH